jgi:hypothetical protein
VTSGNSLVFAVEQLRASSHTIPLFIRPYPSDIQKDGPDTGSPDNFVMAFVDNNSLSAPEMDHHNSEIGADCTPQKCYTSGKMGFRIGQRFHGFKV